MLVIMSAKHPIKLTGDFLHAFFECLRLLILIKKSSKEDELVSKLIFCSFVKSKVLSAPCCGKQYPERFLEQCRCHAHFRSEFYL